MNKFTLTLAMLACAALQAASFEAPDPADYTPTPGLTDVRVEGENVYLTFLSYKDKDGVLSFTPTENRVIYEYSEPIIYEGKEVKITDVAPYAFCCSRLDWFASEVHLNSIMPYAFKDAADLTIVTFEQAVKAIDEYAFAGCDNLQYIEFGYRYGQDINCPQCAVPEVTPETFAGVDTDNLVIMVPESLFEYFKADPVWGKMPYLTCYDWHYDWFSASSCSLDGYDIQDGVASIVPHGIAMPDCPYCTYLIDSEYTGDITFPATVTTNKGTFDVTAVSNYAFFESDVTSVRLPDTVERIAANAFRKATELTEVTLGSGVRTIGHGAFNSCGALRTVVSRNTVPPVVEDANTFYGVNLADATLIVPDEAIDAYRAAEHWRDFGTIIKQSAGIAAVTDDNAPAVTVTDGVITVHSGDGTPAQVYTLDGALAATVADGASVRLTPGAYIVTTHTASTKIIVD